MIFELYKFLNTNTNLINLIGQDRIFPIFTDSIDGPALVYNSRLTKSTLNVYEMLFSINIIASSFDAIIPIETLLNNLLNFLSPSVFKQLGNYYFNSLPGGTGSIIYNSKLQVYEKNISFKITYKEMI